MLMRADIIMFLKDGKVVERGTHAELLAKNGHYAAFVRRQSTN
jgi:ABC-type multidrug transport system fused ATPase/permease subunit